MWLLGCGPNRLGAQKMFSAYRFLISLILAAGTAAAFKPPPTYFRNHDAVSHRCCRNWLRAVGSASYKNTISLSRRTVQRVQLETKILQTILCSSMDATGKNSDSEGGGDLPMSFLQQRIAEMQASEVLKDRRCAKNWSEGRCSTRVVAVLNDDWVRQVRHSSKPQIYPLQPLVTVKTYFSPVGAPL